MAPGAPKRRARQFGRLRKLRCLFKHDMTLHILPIPGSGLRAIHLEQCGRCCKVGEAYVRSSHRPY